MWYHILNTSNKSSNHPTLDKPDQQERSREIPVSLRYLRHMLFSAMSQVWKLAEMLVCSPWSQAARQLGREGFTHPLDDLLHLGIRVYIPISILFWVQQLAVLQLHLQPPGHAPGGLARDVEIVSPEFFQKSRLDLPEFRGVTSSATIRDLYLQFTHAVCGLHP